MYDLFAQFLCGDIGIVPALAPDADAAEVDRLLRAVLQAAEALDAVIAYDCPSVFEADVALWAEHGALTAAYAAVVDAHLCCLEPGYFRPALALHRIHRVIGRAAVTAALRRFRQEADGPYAIVAETIKGKGLVDGIAGTGAAHYLKGTADEIAAKFAL